MHGPYVIHAPEDGGTQVHCLLHSRKRCLDFAESLSLVTDEQGLMSHDFFRPALVTSPVYSTVSSRGANAL